MEHNVRYGVSPNKLYAGGANRPFPDDFVEVDQNTYSFISENFDVLKIEVRENSLLVSVDLPAYKRAALAKLSLDDFVLVNGQKIYDFELALLHTHGLPVYLRSGLFYSNVSSVSSAFALRNQKYHETKAAINAAVNPSQVDEALEKWQTN